MRGESGGDPSTLRNLVSLVPSVFVTAALDRLISASPFARVTLPRYDRERVVPLTVDQVRALADTVARRYRAMVLTQAGPGLRVEELFALRLVDVHLLSLAVVEGRPTVGWRCP